MAEEEESQHFRQAIDMPPTFLSSPKLILGSIPVRAGNWQGDQTRILQRVARFHKQDPLPKEEPPCLERTIQKFESCRVRH